MRLSDKNAQKYYLSEAATNNWSVRTLDRNISTLYYQRLLSSQKKDLVIAEMQEKTADFQQDKLEFINNLALRGKVVFLVRCFSQGTYPF